MNDFLHGEYSKNIKEMLSHEPSPYVSPSYE